MRYKLVSFGLGNILIKFKGCDNGWDLIRRQHKIPNLWEKYMEGLLTRKEAKVGEYILWKLKGIKKSKLRKDLKKFRLMKGAKQTIKTLKKNRITPVIISDNPEFLVREVAKILKIKHIAYNRIIFDKRGYAYDTKPTHPSKDIRVSKLKALRDFAKKKKISLRDCAVIGNGSTDISIFRKAGFSIAFNSREKKLKKLADKSIKSNDLRRVLRYLVKN
jgi:phosphoserine phosphatase